MKNSHRGALIVTSIFSFMMAIGCASEQQVQSPKPVEYSEPVCIQGTVRYRTPGDANLIPFSDVKVNAWRHDETKKPFAETMAEADGKYCLEVPLGEYGVDIRVWGMVNVGDKSYTCTASEDDIKLGKTKKKCGEDCIRVNLVVECKEFTPSRRLGR
jgi:hypothetical protein